MSQIFVWLKAKKSGWADQPVFPIPRLFPISGPLPGRSPVESSMAAGRRSCRSPFEPSMAAAGHTRLDPVVPLDAPVVPPRVLHGRRLAAPVELPRASMATSIAPWPLPLEPSLVAAVSCGLRCGASSSCYRLAIAVHVQGRKRSDGKETGPVFSFSFVSETTPTRSGWPHPLYFTG
jgi:hypothetical protein